MFTLADMPNLIKYLQTLSGAEIYAFVVALFFAVICILMIISEIKSNKPVHTKKPMDNINDFLESYRENDNTWG
jgi:hypothetical protein